MADFLDRPASAGRRQFKRALQRGFGTVHAKEVYALAAAAQWASSVDATPAIERVGLLRSGGGCRDSRCGYVTSSALSPGHELWRPPKASPVPVDTPPPARVAGPIPHFRKFSFVIGATATTLTLVLVYQLMGLFS